MYKLISTYELFVSLSGADRLLRIEVFNSVENNTIFRARIWLQNTYNLYPTFMNLSEDGKNLQKFHSSDEMNMEITSLIANDPSFITGNEYGDEREFLDFVISLVNDFKERQEK